MGMIGGRRRKKLVQLFLPNALMLLGCGKMPNEMRFKSGDFVRVFFRGDVE
jgi:hypothetical protein